MTRLIEGVGAVCVVAAAFAASLFDGDTKTGYLKVKGEWCYISPEAGEDAPPQNLQADSETFIVLTPDEYAKDRDSVFYLGRKINGADPTTFGILDDTNFSRDAEHVYVMGRRIFGADPTSFQPISGMYGRDALSVYCGTVPMDVENINDFEVVMASDRIFSSDVREDLDSYFGDSFDRVEVSQDHPILTTHDWSRDGVSYYYGPGKVMDADYETFTPVSEFGARDAIGTFDGPFRKEVQ